MKSVSVRVLCTERVRGIALRAILAGSFAAAGFSAIAEARIFYARDEALKLAFPDAATVETRDIVLTAEQHDRIEKLAGAPLDTRLVTLYVGWRGDQPVSYALFDSHTVRTFPETIIVVISPTGTVQATHILAFQEPEEYLPPARWLEKLSGAELTDQMQVGRGVAAITGSTLSTRAATSGIRRTLAIWNVVVGGR